LRTPSGDPPRFGEKHAFLLRKLFRARDAGTIEIELNEDDIARLCSGDAPVPEGSFAAVASVAAESTEAIRAGRFQTWIHSCIGPSGAVLFGRFCRTSPELEAHVRAALADEMALRPDAIFAELVYWPGGERADLVLRPVLRTHEIPYLSRSGAASEQQISVDDLWLSVAGERLVLHSHRLGKEVIVRLTSPYNFVNPNDPPLFRFLAALQAQQNVHFMWSWGPLEALDFLPRLRIGRIILCPARWRIDASRLAEITALPPDERQSAFRRLALELGLPRWLVLGEIDQKLCIDRDNPVLVDTLLHGSKGREFVTVTELWPDHDRLCVTGPEGRFAHEIILPVIASPACTEGARSSARSPGAIAAGPRTFAPGSEWLYAKFYTGRATGDEILLDVLAPLARRALQSSAIDSWFFIRYGDPEHHLRVRFHGEPRILREKLLPDLERATRDLLAERRIWRMQFDTYERESERYGGEIGTALSEQLFHADSDAVLDVLSELRDGATQDERLALTLKGVDGILDDLGLALAEKRALAELLADSGRKQLQTEAALVHELGTKYRRAKPALQAVFDFDGQVDGPIVRAMRVLDRRSRRIGPVAQQIRDGIRRGVIAVPLPSLAASYAHMHAVRALRSSVRLHELVIYDFLRRIYESKLSRAARTG